MGILRWVGRKIGGFFSWYKSLFKGRAWYTKLWFSFVTMVVLLMMYLGMVDINFLGLFGKSPGFSSILSPPLNEATEIYSADNVLIGKFYNENRTPVAYEDISPVFWKALIDTEDERYFNHFGIDFQGLAGALKDAVLRHPRGASTITQQLAKNMFRVRTQYSTGLLGKIPGLNIVIMKSKEWIIATKLEMVYSKKEILTMYANTVEFGSNAFGIKTASKIYFNTTPDKLTTAQAAALVGMLKATSYYNPVTHPENCLSRRNVVLHNMLAQGDLDESTCRELCSLPLGLQYTPESVQEGSYSYFREAVSHELQTWCKDYGYDLYNSGLKIYTTIDTKMQQYAERAVREQMRQLQQSFDAEWNGSDPWRDEKGRVIPHFIEDIAKRLPLYEDLKARFPNDPDSITYYLNKPHPVKVFSYSRGKYETEMSTLDSIRHSVKYLHSGFIAMEPQTGAVKAWVGDIDFSTWKYDKVTAKRQPGSTFKLFVYTEAMNQGLTPCDKRRDEPVTVPVYYRNSTEVVDWKPTNAGGHFSGDSIPLKTAFAKSLNSIAVRLSQEVGVRNIVNTAHNMGIKSDLGEHPSLVIGSADVSLFEMASAYSTIANDGYYQKPVLVTSIIDSDGNEVYVGATDKARAIPYRSAYLMQLMLKGGVNSGTSRALKNYIGNYFGVDAGGKTGTTNNNSDAWFMGVTPKLVVGAWVGGEYRSIHFRSGALGQGARAALPICGRFLQSVLGDPKFADYRARFEIPNGEEVPADLFDCSDYYVPRQQPVVYDSVHTVIDEPYLDDEGNLIAPMPVDDEPVYEPAPQPEALEPEENNIYF